jgi:hypothetical protein
MKRPAHSRPAAATSAFVAVFVGLLVWLGAAGAARAQTHIEAPPELPAQVDALEVTGLWRTKGYVVQRELPWRPGDVVDAEQWTLGIQRLWNMGIFSRVQARLEQQGERRVAVIELEERWTVNLLFRPTFGGGATQILVGLYDINTLGRYFESGALYQWFNRNSGGQGWLRNTRLFDRRLEGSLYVESLVRPRVDYGVVRSRVQVEVINWHWDHFLYGARIEAMDDWFIPLGGHEFRPPAPSKTLGLGGMLRWGLVNTVRIRQTGWSLELRPSVNLTNAAHYPATFGRFFGEWLYFKMLGNRWNLAWRAQVGAMTRAQPQHHFFLGGFDLLRGYRDNFAETRAYALSNVEVRFTAVDMMFLAIQPTVFADVAIAQNEVTGRTQPIASAGGGVRVLVPRLVRSGFRLDLAVPLTPLQKPGVSFGVFQFF